MIISKDIIEGKFIDESKNRFICRVLIGEKVFECYVPSASKLNNYLNLKGKNVLLIKNKGNNTRTQYSLFAVMYYRKYIILNLSIANDIVQEYLHNNYLGCKISKEKYIGEYKSDFLVCGENNIIVEVKAIISVTKESIFPTVYSERAVTQLKYISDLLTKGWKVQYFYISLSPIVNRIEINCNDEFSEYHRLLKECISKGMFIRGFNIYYENNKLKIGKELKILLR